MLFFNWWEPDKKHMLENDEEIELYFEIIDDSNCLRFQFIFKHFFNDQKSFFNYFAWSLFMTALSRFEIDYFDLFMFDQYTFFSFLSNVQFQKYSNYFFVFDVIRTWRDEKWNYFLKINWRFEKFFIEINVNLITQNWSQINRVKFETWKILKKIDIELTLAIFDFDRIQKCWSFFANQSFSTLSSWWRYANLIHQHQIVVRDLSFLKKGIELFQYHRRLKNSNFEIVPMIYLNRYLTSIEYEVFAIKSLFRDVENVWRRNLAPYGKHTMTW